MKEIELSKTNRNFVLRTHFGIFCICASVAVYCLYFVIKNIANHTIDRKILVAIFYLVLSPLFAKALLDTIIILLRFKNFRVKLLEDKLIVQTDTKKCEIPMAEDTNIVHFLGGWLISWPSEKGIQAFLIPEELLGGEQFRELIFYFREKTNYIPSGDIIARNKSGVPVGGKDLDYYQPDADYVAAKKEENEILKSLKINTFWQFPIFYNRLKYIKWPS